MNSRILDLIYGGPVERPPWQSLVVECTRQLQSEYCAMYFSSSFTDDVRSMYCAQSDGSLGYKWNREHFAPIHAQSPSIYSRMEPQRVHTLKQLAAGDSDWMRVYRDYSVPAGIEHTAWVHVRTAENVSAWLALVRLRGAPDFTTRELDMLTAMIPHLTRAVGLFDAIRRVEWERAVYQTIVDTFGIGTVVLDENGAVTSFNSIAKEMLAECMKGVSLQRGHRLIAARHHSSCRPLGTVLKGMLQAKTAAKVEVLRIPRQGAAHLGAVIRRIDEPCGYGGEGTPRLIVFLLDPLRNVAAPVDLIGKLFGLTPSEASVSALIAQGCTVEHVAQRLGVARHTVRWTLRNVFEKTGIHRQADLVAAILKSSALHSEGSFRSV